MVVFQIRSTVIFIPCIELSVASGLSAMVWKELEPALYFFNEIPR